MGKKISASEAARRIGQSTPTISRAIKSGKLSAEPNPKGGWLIDPSELKRVYGETRIENAMKGHTLQKKGHTLQNNGEMKPPEISALNAEVEALRKELTTANLERERERSQLTDQIEYLREELADEKSERRTLAAQITDQREKAATEAENSPSGGLFGFSWGKRRAGA